MAKKPVLTTAESAARSFTKSSEGGAEAVVTPFYKPITQRTAYLEGVRTGLLPKDLKYSDFSSNMEPHLKAFGNSKDAYRVSVSDDGIPTFTKRYQTIQMDSESERIFREKKINVRAPKLANGLDTTLNSKGTAGLFDAKIKANAEAIDTKTLKTSSQAADGAQEGLSKAGPIGAIISAVSGIGASAGEAIGSEEGEVIKHVFRPETIMKDPNLSAGEKAIGMINPVAGGILAHRGKKEVAKAMREKQEKAQRSSRMDAEIQETPGQVPMLKDGTVAQNITKPTLTEVERDEIVLRKDADGKFTKVADFKGGKTHAQGGEDYVVQPGDIVFPGKKRRTILKKLANKDHTGIETERMRLPKTIPGDSELEKGVDTTKDTDPRRLKALKSSKKIVQNTYLQDNPEAMAKVKEVRAEANKRMEEELQKLHDQDLSDEEARAAEQKLYDEIEQYTQDRIRQEVPDLDALSMQYGEGISEQDKINLLMSNSFNLDSFGGSTGGLSSADAFRGTVIGDAPEVTSSPEVSTPGGWWSPDFPIGGASSASDILAEEEIGKVDPVEDAKGGDTLKRTDTFDTKPLQSKGLPVVDTSNINTNPFGVTATDSESSNDADDPFADSNKKRGVKAMAKGGSDIGSILDYAPAAANIIRGMQKPETVERRFVTPEQINYSDRSAIDRAESERIERAEREDAVAASGGSAQVARAGKTGARSRGFRRFTQIGAAETARKDAIIAKNVSARQAASAQNIQLANQYDETDAMNKAAVDAYTEQGIHDVDRIMKQQRLDAKAAAREKVVLDLLETDNFNFRDNKVTFKG